MHIDFWMPLKLVDDNGNTLQLMNCMCDLTQFVIGILVDDARSANQGKLFMEKWGFLLEWLLWLLLTLTATF